MMVAYLMEEAFCFYRKNRFENTIMVCKVFILFHRQMLVALHSMRIE